MDSATPDPNDYLMVDTQFFTPEFKKRLLSYFTNFDSQCDGLLIHSENFQALNLLQERYREQVKCIYIDPPYNTGNDGFIYRDNYQHSCWLSMIYNSISSSKGLLNSNNGLLFASIGEEEQNRLKEILDIIFGGNFVNTIITRRQDKNLSLQFIDSGLPSLSVGFEYVLCYKTNPQVKINPVYAETKEERASNGYWKGFWNDADRPTMRYEILGVTPKTGQWKWESQKALQAVINYEQYLQNYSDSETLEEYWNRTGRTLKFIRRNPNGKGKNEGVEHWVPPSSFKLRTSDWSDILALNSISHDFQLLFPSPKNVTVIYNILNMGADPSSLIIDYFAGSGTTAHAVINLNREDGGSRKYILVEMGAHFDTVLKPRIEKVVYSPDWKDGKPTSFDKGVSHCFKYIRLESYEDTLNNLELPKSDPIAQSMQPELREEYMLRYLLETESRDSLLDLRMFNDPFGGYCLNIKRPGSEASESTSVDLVETFNYLIGLRVTQYYMPLRYSAKFKRAVDPELPGEEGSRRLVLDGKPKRDDNGKWRFECIEGVVPAHPLNPNNGQTKRVLIIWRNLTGDLERDNAVLDWLADDIGFNDKVPEYDVVYVNGCNNLGADRKETDSYQVRLIEEEFFKKMWEGRQ